MKVAGSVRGAKVVSIAAGLAALYVLVLRPKTMRWGASDDEVDRPLPGDGVVAGRGFRATRAITIDAPPECVWPWIVQIGSGRAGWYALDRIDNGGVPSAQEIVPELQDLRVGDLIPMVVGKEIGPRVLQMEPNRRMLWGTGHEFSWEWVLEPIGHRRTRLITRMHEAYPPLLSRRMLYAIVASSGDIVMHWTQLRRIRGRAERLSARLPGAPTAALVKGRRAS
jgi:hypothetical protein